jgi:hypothetical protein
MKKTEYKPLHEANFLVTRIVTKQNSFGVLDKAEVELNVTIEIQDDGYGWFEYYDVETSGERFYAEGGLWFEGEELVDYDGVFSLSDFIINKLESWGYKAKHMA